MSSPIKELIKDLTFELANLLRSSKLTYRRFLCVEPKYSSYSIGKFSYSFRGFGAPKVMSFSPGGNGALKIGKFCSIARGVTIVLGGEHRPDWVTTYPFSQIFEEFQSIRSIKETAVTKGDVFIGNDVWIGMNALILSGVNIGDGAVIGAHSVVTKDVEPYTIVAGNPARVIRNRFDRETVDRLLKIKWWDWEIQRIKDNMPLLLSNRIKEFIEKNSE